VLVLPVALHLHLEKRRRVGPALVFRRRSSYLNDGCKPDSANPVSFEIRLPSRDRPVGIENVSHSLVNAVNVAPSDLRTASSSASPAWSTERFAVSFVVI
jgi:hypothetical protein